VETGLFAATRVGLQSDIELQVHPLWFFLAPHVGAKVQWLRSAAYTLASRHTASYPTPLVKFLSREGTGGVLPVDTVVPHIVNLTQDLLLTRHFGAEQAVTVRAGLRLAGSFGDSTLTTIDLPVVFPRTHAWHEGVVGEMGLAWQGRIQGPLYGSLAIDAFRMPGDQGSYSVEQTATLCWRITNRWALMGGIKYVSGEYPFGEQSHLLPVTDLSYSWSAWGDDE